MWSGEDGHLVAVEGIGTYGSWISRVEDHALFLLVLRRRVVASAVGPVLPADHVAAGKRNYAIEGIGIVGGAELGKQCGRAVTG